MQSISAKPSSQPSTSSMLSTSSAPSFTGATKIKNLLVQQNISDLNALNNPDSPQGCAYEWIINDPIIPPLKPGFDDDRIIQRYVLAVLFCATKGTGWKNNGGWLTGDNECGWDGVTCSSSAVTWLSLSSNRLDGNIPTELGTLNDLSKFSFPAESDGCIYIVLPRYLLLTFNLVLTCLFLLFNFIFTADLWLYSNQLDGTIPTELGNLNNLRKFSFPE